MEHLNHVAFYSRCEQKQRKREQHTARWGNARKLRRQGLVAAGVAGTETGTGAESADEVTV